MSLSEYKITDAQIAQKGVVAAPDKLSGTAAQNKAVFDRLIREAVKSVFNGLIDALSNGGAGEIGVEAIEGVTGDNVQTILESLKILLDGKEGAAEAAAALLLKADKTETAQHIKSVSFNAQNGVFTFTKQNGQTVTIDTLLEKLAVNFQYDATTQELVLTLADGTTQRISLSAFITETEFVDSDQIDFSVSSHKVTATIKQGSITDAMLSSGLVTLLRGYVSSAAGSATNASTSAAAAAGSASAASGSAGAAAASAEAAAASKTAAAGSASSAAADATAASNSKTAAASSASTAGTKAQDSEAWAVGKRNGQDVPSSDETYHNNAKYWAGQAQQAAGGGVTSFNGRSGPVLPQSGDYTAAQVGAVAATEKGAANGVATLGEDGKVPGGQIPAMDYIPTSQKGAANGVASLGADGKVPSTQLPAMSYMKLVRATFPAWTAATLSSSASWKSVTYGNGKFVAVAYNSTDAAYSADGINWTTATLPSSTGWASVTYGNGKFVVVASGTSAAYSTDGITWTAATLPSSTGWASVTYGSGKFVAIASNSDKAAYSTDGINWTETTLPASTYWYSVTYGNGKFVAVAYNSLTSGAYSTDGINWTAVTLPASPDWRSVTYGNGKFVAVASIPPGTKQAAYSTDGINWTETTLPSYERWYSVIYGNGKFVAVANSSNKAAYSTDGINWTAATLPSSADWQSVTYGNGKFVAVAYSSDKAAYSTDIATIEQDGEDVTTLLKEAILRGLTWGDLE